MSIRVLEAADLHLDSHQVGGWDPKQGMHSNWVEAFRQLNALVDTANDNDVDLIIINGDVYHSGRPAAEAVALAVDAFNRLNSGIKVIFLDGNHDQTNVVGRHRTPIQAYFSSHDWCFHASSKSELVEFEGVGIGLIPWHRVAGTASLDQTSSVLRDSVLRLEDEASDYRTSILGGHFTFDEVTFGPRRGSEVLMSTSVSEATIPADLLDDGPWSLIRAGHVHKRQQVGKRSMYVGSTYKVSFSEADEAKGVEIVDINSKGKITHQEFVEFDVRELMKIDATKTGKIRPDIEEVLQSGDILRVIIGDDGLSGKSQKLLDSLRRNGVQVQEHRTLKERERTRVSGVALETPPDQIMAKYIEDNVDGPKVQKRRMNAFAECFSEVQ